MTTHQISEYVDNLPLKASFCKGYRTDEVYEVICTLSSMYNQVLSEAYKENEELKKKIEVLERLQSGLDSKMEEERFHELQMVTEEESNFESAGEQTAEEKIEQLSAVTEKELQRLKRSELLEIMLSQSKENDALKKQIEEDNHIIEVLKRQLNNQRITIKEAGNIADASLKLNGVFEAAQQAAQQYIDNIKNLYEQEYTSLSKKETEIENRCTAMMQATKERCEYMKQDAEKECAIMRDTVEKECREREVAADHTCRSLDLKAKEAVDKRWEELEGRLEAFYNARDGVSHFAEELPCI